MIWSCAARYGYHPDWWTMPENELLFWYKGHKTMYEEEVERMKAMTGQGGKK